MLDYSIGFYRIKSFLTGKYIYVDLNSNNMLKISQNTFCESEAIFKFQRSSNENVLYEIKSKTNEMRVTYSSEDNFLFANNNGINQKKSRPTLFNIQLNESTSPNLFTLQVENEELYLTINENANDEDETSLGIEKLAGIIKEIFQIERTNILVSEEIKKILNKKLNNNLFTLQSFIHDQNIFVQPAGLALLKVGDYYPTVFEFIKCNEFYKIKLFSLNTSSEKYLVKNTIFRC